jgi:hypothetical protein
MPLSANNRDSKSSSSASRFFWGCAFGFLGGLGLSNVLSMMTAIDTAVRNDNPMENAVLECPPARDCPKCNYEEIDRDIEHTSMVTQFDAVFNEDVPLDPKLAVAFFNNLCNSVVKSSSTKSGGQLALGPVLFCYKHILTYKRNYSYDWDNAVSSEMGYYMGTDLPPYQMDTFQYSAIHAVMASIPAKTIKHELEALGKDFTDDPSNYNKWNALSDSPRGEEGPRVLFWGCGSDTPMHALLVKFLGGVITFIDNSASFAETCKKSHPDIVLIQPTGTIREHTALIEKLPQDGSALDTDDLNDPLTESQWMKDLSGIEFAPPWDIIVVDGPGPDLGRSQPLYMAKRLAQSYSPNHYTHIFLHDASRRESCVIANAIMGHDPNVYIGNTLPRKGLKHWRVPGRNRNLPPTMK